MPKHEHKHTKFQPRPQQSQETIDSDKDTVDAESEKWNPTPEVFDAFLVRDYELATQNINMLMSARRAPMSARELKDQSLHSTDVIERVLTSGVQNGFLTENKGKFSLI
jgi:hypothetical protein